MYPCMNAYVLPCAYVLQDGRTAAMRASLEGNVDELKRLIAAGADLNIKDRVSLYAFDVEFN